MKVIHLNRSSSFLKTAHDYLESGKQREKEGDREGAIAMYEQMVKRHYQKEFGYQRVMILLRNVKNYKKELEVIDKAIADFEELYSRRNILTDKKAITTSRKLIKMMGLKNDLIDYPQPVPRWIKRKQALKKILQKKQ